MLLVVPEGILAFAVLALVVAALLALRPILGRASRARAAEAALAESEGKYRTLVDITRTGYVIVDAAGRVLDANAEYVRLTGQPGLEAIRGRAVTEWTAPYDVARNAAEVQRAVERGGVANLEVDYQHPDGAIVPIEINAALLPDGTIMALCRDITDRRRAEALVHAGDRRMRDLVEASPLPIVALNPAGEVITWNPAAERLFGYPAAEVTGRDLPLVPPGGDGQFRGYLDEALRGNALQGRPVLGRRRDGTDLDLRVSTAPLRGPDGGALGVVAIYEDVSEQRRIQRLDQELQERLLEAQKLESLGVLAGGIAHDFNNLLNLVLGNTHLARTTLPPEHPGLEPLHEVEQATHRAAELTAQMLAYAGRGQFVLGPVDLAAVVRDSSGLIHAAVPAAVRLVLELADGLPAIEADPNQVRQVLLNLVTNAGEALPGGHGTVTVRAGQVDADPDYLAGTRCPEAALPGRYLFLEVVDDGAGITPEVARRMFEPFFTTRFAGRGLGLAAVQGIVRRHKGTLQVDAAAGRTAIRVLFPVAEPRQPTEPAPAAPAAPSGAVLLVDDEEHVLRLMRVFLQRAGFRVLTASSGAAALELIRSGPVGVGLVILDLTMPGLSGAATLMELRKLVPDLPVVITSGYSEEEAAQHCNGQPIQGFLPKPYLSADLVAVAGRHLMAAAPDPAGSPVPEAR